MMNLSRSSCFAMASSDLFDPMSANRMLLTSASLSTCDVMWESAEVLARPGALGIRSDPDVQANESIPHQGERFVPVCVLGCDGLCRASATC